MVEVIYRISIQLPICTLLPFQSQQLLDLTELVEHLTQNTEQEKQRTDKILKQLQTECERLHEKDKYLSVFVEKVVPTCTLSNQNILEALKDPPTATCDFSLESLCTAILNGRTSSKKLVSDAEVRDMKSMHALQFNLAALFCRIIKSHVTSLCMFRVSLSSFGDFGEIFYEN